MINEICAMFNKTPKTHRNRYNYTGNNGIDAKFFCISKHDLTNFEQIFYLMAPSLEATDLNRYYGEFCALDVTNFAITEPEIIVLSGQNGAGKSTLLHCLAGLIRPTSGTVKICGYDLYKDEIEAKRKLAFVPDIPRFYTELTAWEHLKFIALAHNAQKDFETHAATIMTELGLWDSRDLYPHHYSRGMRLKLGLALAFIRPFQVLIMDEPASALDPQSLEYLKNKILQLRDRGSIIVFTSHNLELISDLKAHHWIMQKGELEQDG
jgi:ABC-2 type transport system ATP-binding protein